jgi:hypothetical protein
MAWLHYGMISTGQREQRFLQISRVSRNGFADDLWKDICFQWHRERVAVSAKVYFLGRSALPVPLWLVTTFYMYLQLTPASGEPGAGEGAVIDRACMVCFPALAWYI